MVLEVLQLQSFSPIPLMQIHQHGLLELRLPIRHSDRVVMPVQAMDKSLDAGLVDMSDIRSRLSRFLTHDDTVGVDESEGVNHDFALDGLDGVDDYCY